MCSSLGRHGHVMVKKMTVSDSKKSIYAMLVSSDGLLTYRLRLSANLRISSKASNNGG